MNEAEKRSPILIAPCPVGLARQPTPCRRLFVLAFPAPYVRLCRAPGIQRLTRTLLAIKGLASSLGPSPGHSAGTAREVPSLLLGTVVSGRGSSPGPLCQGVRSLEL